MKERKPHEVLGVSDRTFTTVHARLHHDHDDTARVSTLYSKASSQPPSSSSSSPFLFFPECWVAFPRKLHSPGLNLPNPISHPHLKLPSAKYPTIGPCPQYSPSNSRPVPDSAERACGLQPGDTITVAAYIFGVDADEPRSHGLSKSPVR